MIAKILGTIWIILGLLWLIRPAMLRRRLIRKMTRKMKWVIYGFILILMFSLLGVVIKAQGLFLKIAGLIGIFFVVKVIFTITSKASEKVSGFWTNKPLSFFRIWALVMLISGILLILT